MLNIGNKKISKGDMFYIAVNNKVHKLKYVDQLGNKIIVEDEKGEKQSIGYNSFLKFLERGTLEILEISKDRFFLVNNEHYPTRRLEEFLKSNDCEILETMKIGYPKIAITIKTKNKVLVNKLARILLKHNSYIFYVGANKYHLAINVNFERFEDEL